MKTKLVFCAREQLDTEHQVTVDGNGEFVFTCPCGAFFKLPGDLTAKDIKSYLSVHKAHNEGQVTVEQIEAENAQKLAVLDEA